MVLPAHARRTGHLRPGLRAEDEALAEEDVLFRAVWSEVRDPSPGDLGGETGEDVTADRLPRIVGDARVVLRAVEALA